MADGAVSFCIGHFVADKFAFGTNCNVIYVLYNPEHVPRSADKYVNAIGKDQWIFGVILLKVFLFVVMIKLTITNFMISEYDYEWN